MPLSVIYHTVEDQDNPDYVEQFGPFKCKTENAWLGSGYYFWDFHIELGHWWGNQVYGEDSYMICEAYCDITSDKCYDLHNNGNHQSDFRDVLLEMINSGIVRDPDEITVPRVIEYIKKKVGFEYEAIRARGINTAKKKSKTIDIGTRILFDENLPGYLEPIPPVQLCLFTKRSLSLQRFRIIWPEHYVEEIVF